MLPAGRTLPFPVLLDVAWEIARRRFAVLYGPLAVALVPIAFLMHAGLAWWNLRVVAAGEEDPGLFCGAFLAFFLGMLVVLLGYFVLSGTLMLAATDAAAGRPVSVGRSLRTFLRPAFWGSDLLAKVLIGIGWMFCLLPGLVMQVGWGLRLPIMLLEERFGFDAFRRSWELLTHNPHRGLRHHPMVKMGLLLLLSMLLGWAVSMVVQAPAAIVNQIMMFRQLAGGEEVDPEALVRASLWLSIPAGLIASFAQLAVEVYVAVVTAAFTLDQRRRREGADLEAELERLAGRGAAS